MQQELSDRFIRDLAAPTSGRIEITDSGCKGLVLRVTTTGAKSFSFKYRAKGGGGVQRVTIGEFPDIKVKAARKRADAMRGIVADQGDPAAKIREDRAGGRSFAKLADDYLEKHAKVHKRPASARADARNLRKHVLPKWGKRDYTTIRRNDVGALIEGIIDAGKPVLANRVQALVSKVFSYAIDRADAAIEVNPCWRMKRRGVEKAGKRVLADAELSLFWHNVIERDLRGLRTSLGLQLALLTGCRIGEIAGMARAELIDIGNPDKAAWLRPPERIKNGRERSPNPRAHWLPLCPMARKIVLDLLGMIEPSEPFLFPTIRSRSAPMHPNSFTQAMARFSERIDCATWKADPPSPHDLRRTVETRLASIGIPKETRDRVLNHAPEGIGDRHYNQWDYQPEKRRALLRWETTLAAIIDGSASVNVLSIDLRRAV